MRSAIEEELEEMEEEQDDSESKSKNEGSREGQNISKRKAQLRLIGIFGGLGLSLFFLVTGKPFLGLASLFLGIIVPFLFSKEGRKLLSDIQNKQQNQQQNQSDTKQMEICSECGWQNPLTNNYCVDCGSEL